MGQEEGGILRKSLFSNGEQMWGAIRSLLAGIDLYHARDIERVDAGEGICCNQDDTRVCVNLLLQVAELNGLEDCMVVSMRAEVTVWGQGRSYQQAR